MGGILGFSPSAPYRERITALERGGVVLWDVLEKCERAGSGDEKIRNEKPNRLGDFLERYSSIRAVFFNGHSAEKYFHEYFPSVKGVRFRYLPSTSPRYALKTVGEKAAAVGKGDVGILEDSHLSLLP